MVNIIKQFSVRRGDGAVTSLANVTLGPPALVGGQNILQVENKKRDLKLPEVRQETAATFYNN